MSLSLPSTLPERTPSSLTVKLSDPTTLRFAVLDEDFPLSTRESLVLVDRAQTGFGTLDAVVASSGQPAEVPLANYEPEVRDHFDKLYDSIWQQLLGVVDYRQRLLGGRNNAEAFVEARALRSRLRKRAVDQKEILNLCSYEADRATLVVEKPVAGDLASQPLADGAPRPVVHEGTIEGSVLQTTTAVAAPAR